MKLTEILTSLFYYTINKPIKRRLPRGAFLFAFFARFGSLSQGVLPSKVLFCATYLPLLWPRVKEEELGHKANQLFMTRREEVSVWPYNNSSDYDQGNKNPRLVI